MRGEYVKHFVYECPVVAKTGVKSKLLGTLQSLPHAIELYTSLGYKVGEVKKRKVQGAQVWTKDIDFVDTITYL